MDALNTSQIHNAMPEETMMHVFSFLPVSDLNRVSLVCKIWYRISSDNLLWRRFLPSFGAEGRERSLKAILATYTRIAKMRKFQFCGNEIYSPNEKSVIVWKKGFGDNNYSQDEISFDVLSPVSCLSVQKEGMSTQYYVGHFDGKISYLTFLPKAMEYSLLHHKPIKNPITAITHIKEAVICGDTAGHVYTWNRIKRYDENFFTAYEKTRPHRGMITCFAIDRKEPLRYFSGSIDKTITIWRLIKNKDDHWVPTSLQKLETDSEISCITASPSTNTTFISGHANGTIRVWHHNGIYELSQEIQAHDNTICDIHFTKLPERIITSSMDGKLKIWNWIRSDETHSRVLRLQEESLEEEPILSIHTISAKFLRNSRFPQRPEETFLASKSCIKIIKMPQNGPQQKITIPIPERSKNQKN